MLQYQDPWKDDLYGKLKGDKADAFVRLVFEEAKVYTTENAYIIAGKVTQYKGVVRSYKPELPLQAGYCAVPIYGSEYEIRRKDTDGKWVGDKFQPTIFEKALYERIKGEESVWVGDNIYWAGQLSLAPNMMCEDSTKEQINELIDSNVLLQPTQPSGSLPVYTPPKTYGGNRGAGKSYGMSPDQKLEWFKTQLAADTKSGSFTNGTSLIELLRNFNEENSDEPHLTLQYIQVLEACI